MSDQEDTKPLEEATHEISLSDDENDRQDAAEEGSDAVTEEKEKQEDEQEKQESEGGEEEPEQKQEEDEAEQEKEQEQEQEPAPAVLSMSASSTSDEPAKETEEATPEAEAPAAEDKKQEDDEDGEQDDDEGEKAQEEEAEEEKEKAKAAGDGGSSKHEAEGVKEGESTEPTSPTSPTSASRSKKESVSSVSSPTKRKGKLDVTVTDPKKVGEGMSSYVVYTVHTRTDMDSYQPMNDISVEHRYSDFHTLFKLLVADHPGVIVPPPPPKDALNTGIGKFKSQTEDLSPFLERRGRALQRFMRKIAEHPVLRHDEHVKTFLTTETKLPKPKSSTLSNIAQKLASYVESEEWFAETTKEVDVLESQLKQLHTAVTALVARRKELSGLMTAFAERFSALADSEEMETLSGAMHQLADVEAKMANLHTKHRDREFYDLSEVVYDYLCLITSIRTAFQQRISAFKQWQSAESTLLKKKDLLATYTAKNKTDKVDQAQRDVEAAETAVQEAKVVFDEISARIKQEYKRCGILRARDMKTAMVRYAKRMAELEEKIENAWTNFLPKAKGIGQEA